MLNSNNKFVLIIFLLLFTVAFSTVVVIFRGLDQPVNFSEFYSDQNKIIFQIKPGTSFKHIATDMEKQHLLTNKLAFIIYGRIKNKTGKIQAGEYEITSGTSPIEMLNQFIEGKVTQYTFSIIEGWTFRQLIKAIVGTPSLQISIKDLSDEAIMERLGYKGVHPEGRFFADTYQFPKGTSDIVFLKRAYQRMEQVLAEEWSEKDENLPYKNDYEALIMASIIEKETGLASEREQIAGVFVRRLQKKMRLQTDPTVIYGLGDKYKGNITRKHLSQKTPYNTYRIMGLPPTPIAMPGREAIHAALHPAKGNSLYFVAKGDGSHYFSETLAEHSTAVKKYQWKRVKDYRSTPK